MTNKKTFTHNLPPLPDSDYLFPDHSTPLQPPEKDWDMPQMDSDGNLVPSTLLPETKEDNTITNTDNGLRDNRTGTTDSSLTTVSSDTTETMLYKKYVKTWRRGERRLRRFSWEVYDDIPDDISSLSIKLSAELNERVSDSQLVRVLLEEGIKRLKKELNIN
jgi:hypothetical protein